jgi:hypothetical protein
MKLKKLHKKHLTQLTSNSYKLTVKEQNPLGFEDNFNILIMKSPKGFSYTTVNC